MIRGGVRSRDSGFRIRAAEGEFQIVNANGKSQMDEKAICPLPFFSDFVRTADPEMGSALPAANLYW